MILYNQKIVIATFCYVNIMFTLYRNWSKLVVYLIYHPINIQIANKSTSQSNIFAIFFLKYNIFTLEIAGDAAAL